MGISSGNKNGKMILGTGTGYDPRIKNKLDTQKYYYINFLDLYNLAIGRFNWLNIEKHKYFSTRVLNQSLIVNGSCVMFMNDIMGLVALPSANAGKFDINNVPGRRYISRPNGFHAELTDKDSVLCYNDDTRCSFIPVIDYYAEQMTLIDRIVMQNLKLQRKPKVIVANSDNKDSVKKMIENNQEYDYAYLLVEENIVQTTTKSQAAYALDLSVPYIGDRLRTEKDRLRNEYLTRLGINNTRYEKRERMTNQELYVNNEEINSYRATALRCRKDACLAVNEMFGTDIDVEYAIGMGEIYGNVYDNSTGNNIPDNTEPEPT